MFARFRAAAPAIGLLGLLIALAVLAPRRPAAAEPAEWAAPPFAARWQTRAAIDRQADARSFSDPIHRRLYLIGDQPGIDVYNSDTVTLVGHIPIRPDFRFLTPDGERLYLTTSDGYGDPYVDIHLIDTATLVETRTITYACTVVYQLCYIRGLVEGSEGRLYVARADSSTFDVIDGVTGEVLDTVTTSAEPFYTLNLAAHGDTLYVASYFDDEAAGGVGVYDISDVSPVRISFQATEGYLPFPVISADGSFLTLERYSTVAQYRTQPLEFLWSVPVSLAGIYPDGDVLAYNNLNEDQAQFISVRDAQTGEAVRGVVEPYSAWGSFEYILPIGEEGLAIDLYTTLELRRPTDHASALPTLFNRSCPNGPVVDTFDDPASGWPVEVGERVIYRYLNSAYEIVLVEGDTWTAVTRGDLWQNAESVEFIGNLDGNQNGTFGLIFGLNGDWSDFYSFEVYPEELLWIVLHYQNGVWTLIYVGESTLSSYGSPVIVGMRRATDGSGKLELTLGRQPVYQVDDVPGRVGLAASAFDEPATARFDNYVFTGENCGAPPLGNAETRYEIRDTSDELRALIDEVRSARKGR